MEGDRKYTVKCFERTSEKCWKLIDRVKCRKVVIVSRKDNLSKQTKQ